MDTHKDYLVGVNSFVPPTFDAAFHSAHDGKAWIHRMPYRMLGNTGLPLSLLAYGGSALANFYNDNSNRAESIEAIQLALRSGVNYIETGPWYGPSEEIIGEALKDAPRKTFYISTKAGRYSTPGWEGRFDFTGQRVLKSIEESLEKLGQKYIHDVEFCLDQEILLKQTLPALESVVKAGKAKYIGITSYCLESMKNLIEKSSVKIDNILSYSRYNFNDLSLESYVPFFESKGVGVINASPVAMGLYTTRGPPAWHAASEKVKKLAIQASELSSARGISIEHAALGFGLRPRNPKIASTLVSMPTKAILQENLEIVTKPYTSEDELLYKDIFKLFNDGLKDEPGHWEGIELNDYKKTMGLL
ncbi:L-galactose dehydrogenase [Orchesella cincta]|uniref:L-galactose dehydrogenase n=1 Tax=Orchesella cincta TaxID=48709 RepID=A0A1D2MZ19_ORCCI|nr:L-galactose dehydrogenase [Orchesella cincta]